MDWSIPVELRLLLDRLDAFIESEIKPSRE
jgi:hypothetical protein